MSKKEKMYTETQVKESLIALLKECGFLNKRQENDLRRLKYSLQDLKLLHLQGVKGLRTTISKLSGSVSALEDLNSLRGAGKSDLFAVPVTASKEFRDKYDEYRAKGREYWQGRVDCKI